jgi:calcineurin-like phosphoesterase family protein
VKRFFTSDQHFFHANILKFKGRAGKFSSLDEMHDHIVSEWNKRVGKRDLVYVVGGFSERLNGELILIAGNHDKRSKRRLTIRDFLEVGFKSVVDEKIIKLSNGEPVLLKHYPYELSHINTIC